VRSGPRPGWTGTWEAAPSATAPALPDTTVRNVVHVSVGGTALRVRLTNRLGTAPLVLDAVTAGRQRPGAPGSPAAVPGSLRAVTFHGARTAVLAPGADLTSDPVPLAVPDGANLLLSAHTPAGADAPVTLHRAALQTNFLAPHGDATADPDGTAYTATTTAWYHVTGVDVLRAPSAGSVVALGDSLTDGTGSTRDANHRWPDLLADRLRTLPATRRPGVLNAGIGGNRLLHDGTGPSALARLDGDVLTRAGVRVLVVLEGVNDLNHTPPEALDPAPVLAAYRTITARAHAHGVRVVGATLTPYAGHRAWTPAREATRQRINAVLRAGGLFDAVADFDAAVRDPDRPERLLPAYDSGDHLHLDDAGLRALAGAVDPARLR
jgi:lysophospholipase L1-like esterase